MSDNDSEKKGFEEKISIISPRDIGTEQGGEFLYTSPATGEKRKATLMGYQKRHDGSLAALFISGTKEAISPRSVSIEELKDRATDLEGNNIFLGAKVRRSNGEIDSEWVIAGYYGEDANKIVLRKGGLKKVVPIDEIVAMNSVITNK